MKRSFALLSLLAIVVAVGCSAPVFLEERTSFTSQALGGPAGVSGCVQWLRSDRGITASTPTGGTVTAWADQSGSGSDVSPDTPGNGPVYVANGGGNNQPYTLWTSRSMQRLNATSMTVNQPMEVFVAARATTPNPPDTSYLFESGWNNNVLTQAPNSTSLYTYDGLSNGPTAGFTANADFIADAVYNGTASQLSINGGPIQTGNPSTNQSAGGVTIGAYGGPGAGHAWGGYIYEVAVYNRTLSAKERAQVLQDMSGRYGIAVAGFTPPNLPGCVQWLRSDLGITATGGTVTAWADQSGNRNGVTPDTPGNGPAYVANGGGNNQPYTLWTSGSMQRLSAPSLTINQPMEVFVAARANSAPTTTSYIFENGCNGNNIVQATTSYALQLGWNNNTLAQPSTANNLLTYDGISGGPATGLTINTDFVADASYNGAASQVSINGGPAGTGNPGSGLAPGGVTIGAYGGPGAGHAWGGNIYEVAVFNRTLSTCERSELLQYMGGRYGAVVQPPSSDVVPAVSGIATDSKGATKAIFTYATCVPSVAIPYGQGSNALLDASNAFIASPRELPPQTFVSVAPAPFVATMTGSALTWQIRTFTATAKSTSTQLPTVTNADGTKDAVLPDGTKVNLDLTPPQDPVATADPPVGAPDNGVLTGTLQVTPGGAASYTLPIAMTPGVAGMAPNLSLAYSSQGPDGIAGQGWSLQGLSVIHKCPRTQQQDGVARPVMMDADPSPPFSSNNSTDGICLDGQRLFEVSGSAQYVPEKKDFSTITYFPSDSHFEVKTKAGETRSYGLTRSTHVIGHGLDAQNNMTTATAIWALERVNDAWGNFFSIQYYQDFPTNGMRVREIDYTGHMNGSGVVDTPTFASVLFAYEPRTDVRSMRFSQSKFPMTQRLKTITTNRGTYTLSYTLDTFSNVISELQSIHYCSTGAATCPKDLTFTWSSGSSPWTQSARYSLPTDIPTGHGLLGAQFVDLDGDGRSDLVYAGLDSSGKSINKAWINTGSGWPSTSTRLPGLPCQLASASGPTGTRFADMDGDGILDFVVDSYSNVLCNSTWGGPASGAPGVWLNRFTSGGGGGWEFHSEFSTIPSTSSFATVQPIDFNHLNTCAPSKTRSCEGFARLSILPASLVDINGDGKMDIVRVEEGAPVPLNNPQQPLNVANIVILINQGPNSNPTWVASSVPVLAEVPPCTTSSASTCLDFDSQPGVTLGDVNRDGFADLIREQYYTGPTVSANTTNSLSVFQQVALNKVGATQKFLPSTRRADCNVTNDGRCGGGSALPFGPQIADLDGDGLYDEMLFGPLSTASACMPACARGPLSNIASGYGVGMNGGAGPWLNYQGDAAPYIQELIHLAPAFGEGNLYAEDFAYALVDINGDGLPDLIRNHFNCGDTSSAGCNGGVLNQGGGQVLYNTGTTWGSGSDTWHRSAGTNTALPGVVPSPITAGCGGAFVDLDGDGLADFIQEEGNNGTTCFGSKAVGRGAWINGASAPFIQTFPNGRAPDTIVSYVHITEAAAHTTSAACDGVNANVYCDDGSADPGTKKVVVPLRVVKKVSKADGIGNPLSTSFADTTYAYVSLRADPNGRGPLGFKRVFAYDHASGVSTNSSYLQAYPYTGLPNQVVRTQVTQNNAVLSSTVTSYCDSTSVGSDGGLSCSPPGTSHPLTPVFVYPFDVSDETMVKQDGSANGLLTESTYRYDDFGNATQVVVIGATLVPSSVPAFPTITSKVTVTTTNHYGSSTGSQEQQQGKVTDVLVTASGDSSFAGVTSHHTTFAYAPISTFGGASSTALALAKKEVEPLSAWPTQEDTVFSYDAFGNVIVTTTCADAFGSCAPGASSPFLAAFNHPPFRTTTVSFDGSGRFPVMTTTTTSAAAGGGTQHVEYSAYDPIKGVLLQKTGQNGIRTCYTYDDLGRPTSETARCGSSSPIASTTAYFNPSPGSLAHGTPSNTTLITVVRPASGATTWTFTDYQGKTIGTVARSFGGGFTETTTTYNALGNVVTATKPFLIQNFADPPPTPYQIKTYYDPFNRVRLVTEDLGAIGANGVKQLATTTTYNGLSLTTTRTVNGSTQNRTETKNVLGKLQSVVDSLSGEIDYQYDPDGNLKVARTPASILVNTIYDARGRKTQTTDTDLGTWNYVFDGFGDLVSQADANNQHFEMTYDELGRMQTKQNAVTGATAQWIYDTAGGAGIGKLTAMVSEVDPSFKGPCALPPGAAVSGGNRSVKAYTYTGFGDLQSVAECADGDTFQTSYEYDTIGRQSRIHYPAVNAQQLAVGYHYTSLGYLQYLTEDSSDFGVLWQAKAMNAFGQVTDEQTRNGVETVQNRNPGNGWLLGSISTAHSDSNTVIQNWTYTFDEVGNLLSRGRADQVADAPSNETFSYDALNRLRGAVMTVGGSVNPTSSAYDYDGNGNLMHKDGHAYTYGGGCHGSGPSGSGLHQVCSIDGGTTFVYDAAGNLTANGGRTVFYNAHNKAAQITAAAGTTTFMYGADDNRVVQVATSGGATSRTVYVGLAGTGKSMYERTTTGATVQHTNFIYAGGAHGGSAFAVRVMANDGTTTATRYMSFDHLGSTTAVSDEKGHIAAATGADTQLLGYDSWGARRNPDGQPAAPSSTFPSSVGNRDFTGQETIPAVGLINMNGRVYDPVIGRFLSPDPNIQTPGDLQNYNRYSYVLNNPLRYTDPTGYDFWSDLGSFFSDPVNDFKLVMSLVVCAASYGAGCTLLGTLFALEGAEAAIASGASFEQTALNVAIGVGVGMLTSGITGELLGPGASPIWGIVAGSASAAATTAISDVVGGGSVGWDVLLSAAISAAQSAATYGLQQAMAPSQASAQVQGGGSGAAQVERDETVPTTDNDLSDFASPAKDTSQWLAGDGAGGPGTPYLPDPTQKPPGWSPDWPEGVDSRGPYSQGPDGTRWYPHPEDGGHWPHYDDDEGGRFPSDSKKPWPDQKRPAFGGQSATNPWGSSSGSNNSQFSGQFTPQQQVAVASVTMTGVLLIILVIALSPAGI